MKKKLAIMLAAIMAVGLLGGCGSDEGKALNEMKVNKYVTLGEYKGIEVNVAPYTVEDAEWDALTAQIYNGYVTAEAEGITDRAVEDGDLVNIDYEGKKDDIAFEGGTAAAQQLEIGSGSFIDGFEAGLVGVNPGETVDLNLTFPENYGNAELAGQAVVFTVTVNFIYPTSESWNDAFVASWGDAEFSTVEDLRQYVYNYLEEYNSYYYQSELENTVAEAFMAQCEFKEVPEHLSATYGANLQKSLESEATMYGMDADTLCYYYYGMDLATFIANYAEESAKQSLAFQAVANEENLNLTEEELDARLNELVTENGYTTVEELIGENTKEDYREYFMFEDVLEFLVENAVVTAE